MVKKYKLSKDSDTYLIPVIERYANNDTLAVVLYTLDYEEYCVLTVNIGCSTNDDVAVIDTNNYPWLLSYVLDNGLGELTGRYRCSGFCEYPEVKFNLMKLNEEI